MFKFLLQMVLLLLDMSSTNRPLQKPPSAIRAIAIKLCDGARSTRGCLSQAKRELIAAARERVEND